MNGKHRFLALLLLTAACSTASPAAPVAEGEPAIAGYTGYAAMLSALESLGESEFGEAGTLGRTMTGRDIRFLAVGRGATDSKPALLIVGSGDGNHIAGSEVALRMAQQLIAAAQSDPATAALLDRLSLYIVPWPAPDAHEPFFTRPYRPANGNARSVDDDRDFADNEDAPRDLNGDGQITLMRVADPAGKWIQHPADNRIMIEVDPKRIEVDPKRIEVDPKHNQTGRYSVYVEGRDADGDERFGEDGPGGVQFDRNFSFRYPYFAPEAGTHPMSEEESRALADFAYDHPNIVAAFCFSPNDNLFHPWKPSAAAESTKIKTSVQSADSPYLDYLAKEYQRLHGGRSAPSSSMAGGAFGPWAYFHYGRWSLVARPWWIPPAPAAAEGKPQRDAAQIPAGKTATKARPSTAENDRRGADDLAALAWMEREKVDGFVPWQPIDHPDFPGQKVEVGGFKAFVRENPPAAELERLAEKHLAFVRRLAELLPRLTIRSVTAEPLGGAIWRITAKVANDGYLPTMASMGRISRQPHPIQVAIELPAGAQLLTGYARRQIDSLAGSGAEHEEMWLVHYANAAAEPVKVRTWSPSVGTAESSTQLSPARSR